MRLVNRGARSPSGSVGLTAALIMTLPAGLLIPLLAPGTARAAGRSLSGVVNTYQAVARIERTSLTLDGTPTGAAQPFGAGDRVLVIQMSGGNPLGGSNLGTYEEATLASVDGSGPGARLGLTAPLTRTYAPGTERVQVIRMAGGAGTSTLTGTVTALPWNGRTGGVVAIAGDVVDLAGRTIDASGDGFTNVAGAASTVLSTPVLGAGATTGRGGDGGGGLPGAGRGGGGSGGGGGAGGNAVAASNAGGARGGGAEPGRSVAVGTNGGRGAGSGPVAVAAGGSGGGGGISGGGGGGGGGDVAVASPGGGGGISGGGGGGSGTLGGLAGAASRAGGGGGGVGSVGNGGDGLPGSLVLGYGSAGGGGGGYGGGGASGGIQGPVSTGSGGGGGGSSTGGGVGGAGNAALLGFVGGAGNAAVATSPTPGRYLDRADPRLMPGGAGGRGSSDSGGLPGGAGGGIVLLDAGQVTGAGSVVANGSAGFTAPTGPHSGSGGGAGGQIRITGRASGASLTVRADGGVGGRPTLRWPIGAGAGGGGGGGGGIWLELVGATDGCGTDGSGARGGVVALAAGAAGGTSPRLTNPLSGLLTVGGGAGGSGLVCTSAPPRFSIGDRVWRDADADGLLEDDEPGLAGVDVTLLDATGAEVARTTSDSDGGYRFDALPSGRYRVRFSTPEGCAFTRQGVGDDPTIDSDIDPFTGVSSPVDLTRSTTGVNAGEVCTTSSPTRLGAYTRSSFTDLAPDETGPFDGATGTVVMSTDDSSSSFLLQAGGLPAAVAGQRFGAQLHFGPCADGDPDAAGPDYNTSLLDGDDPPVVSPQTEAWLDLTADADGNAISSVTVPFLPSAADRSVVITSEPTDPTTGETGTRLACLPVIIF